MHIIIALRYRTPLSHSVIASTPQNALAGLKVNQAEAPVVAALAAIKIIVNDAGCVLEVDTVADPGAGPCRVATRSLVRTRLVTRPPHKPVFPSYYQKL